MYKNAVFAALHIFIAVTQVTPALSLDSMPPAFPLFMYLIRPDFSSSPFLALLLTVWSCRFVAAVHNGFRACVVVAALRHVKHPHVVCYCKPIITINS